MSGEHRFNALEIAGLLGEGAGLEALRTLASGVAHDFNNLLAVILSCAEFAELALPEGSDEAEALGDAKQAAHRASDLCKLILAFSGKRSALPTEVDLAIAVRRAISALQRPDDIEVTFTCDEVLPSMTADPILIDQLVRSLLDNAVDAVGALEVGRRKDASVGVALRHAGEHLELEIRDDGIGMNRETLERAFEPFFTTAYPKRGLGLAAAQGIARSHHGSIDVTTELGVGTTVLVTLPAEAPRSGRRRPTTRPMEFEGQRRVLVVDDESLVARSVARILRAANYIVSVELSGAAALEKFGDGTHFELVVLDMTMPGMDGPETFRRLRACNPAIRVLLTSGYHHLDATEALVATGHCWFMAKPYEPDLLLGLVAEILA